MDKTIYSAQNAVFLRLLRKERKKADLTQDQLADRLGATQSFVSKCERGERRLDVVELRDWCLALGISLDTFARRFEKACQELPSDISSNNR